jgi:hypothetical protein
MVGMAAPNAASTSPPARRSGTTPASRCRSAGCWCATQAVLVREPSDEKEPQAFLCTDLDAAPVDILRWFVRRWRVETTFEEARRHLGLETQRQWSDLAILRTTPALLGLFSLVTLWATQLEAAQRLLPECVRWYPKHAPTFSDALALVRRELWTSPTLDLAAFRSLTGSPRRAETLSRRALPPIARCLPTALTCKAKLRLRLESLFS